MLGVGRAQQTGLRCASCLLQKKRNNGKNGVLVVARRRAQAGIRRGDVILAVNNQG